MVAIHVKYNINLTTRHLKFCYILVFTNLLRTDKENISVKSIYRKIELKKLLLNCIDQCRGVVRTPLKIQHGDCRTCKGRLAVTYFCKNIFLEV